MNPQDVPAPSPDASWEVLDGEAVVFVAGANNLTLLDPVATAVWVRLDGRATVQELAEGLADDYRAPVDTVLTDVLALLADLTQGGLVVLSDRSASA